MPLDCASGFLLEFGVLEFEMIFFVVEKSIGISRSKFEVKNRYKSCDIFNFQGDFYRFSRKKLKNHLTTSLQCIIMNMSVGTSDTPIDRIGPIGSNEI